MDKRNPDHVDSTAIEFASRRNTDAVPSTKKTERRGGMVGVVKPVFEKQEWYYYCFPIANYPDNFFDFLFSCPLYQ
jgi:hypothetical protein